MHDLPVGKNGDQHLDGIGGTDSQTIILNPAVGRGGVCGFGVQGKA